MKILVSNDDGYLAPGILALVDALQDNAEVIVVAPDRNRSGASNSLTLSLPLRVRLTDNGFYCVDGTPTDCVHLAMTGLLETSADMVVSGINAGGNMGDDVLYSGTVAAATEGRFLGSPAIAVSLVGHQPKHYVTAGRVVVDLLDKLRAVPLPADAILNVNVPDVPYADLKGYRATRLGRRHKSEPVVKSMDPRGNRIYWVGPAGPEQDAGPGTDFYAVKTQYVSITPLTIDLTDVRTLATLDEWLQGGRE